MKKAIIIDDEPKARKLLAAMLSDFDSGLDIVAECEDLPAGVKAIHKYKPDLIFLDIEMPGHSGLEILDFFNEDEIDFSIIFTTAYSQYALQAFKISALDYLLKPINMDELREAVRRFHQRERREEEQWKALRQNIDPGKPKKIGLPQSNGIKFVEADQIWYVKGEGAYSEVYCVDNEKLIISRNLKYIEDLLDGLPFMVRCQKSYIVNVHHIRAYIKSDGGYFLVGEQKHQVAVSSDRVDGILQMLQTQH